MSDELRQAAERLRRIQDWENPTAVYGQDYEHDYSHDTALVTQAWLAEHPADEGEPADGLWLEAIGFCEHNNGDGFHWYTLDDAFRIQVVPGDTVHVWIGREWRKVQGTPTRGDVRRLAQVLGVALREETT